MKQHRYQLTLTHVADVQGQPSTYDHPLQIEVGNHDDIYAIVARMRARGDFDADSAAALGIGLKLFSEVMLENKENPLFARFKPHFADFMKTLKSGVASM